MNIDALIIQCHQSTTMQVFVPKRRKPVLIKDVADRLQEIIFELVTEHGGKLIALEVQPDHVHFFINAPTHESPAEIARWVKGRASHHLRKEFPPIEKTACLVDSNLLRGNNRSSQYRGSQQVYRKSARKIMETQGFSPDIAFIPSLKLRGSQLL